MNMFKKSPCVIFFYTNSCWFDHKNKESLLYHGISKIHTYKTVLPAYYFGGKRSSAIDMGRVGEG